jgi:alkyl hydroperoxide reductase subunit AhpC
LLTDFWPHGAIASAYGVFDAERGCAVRGTFVVDRAGLIRWSVVNPMPEARNPDDYAEALASLGADLR